MKNPYMMRTEFPVWKFSNRKKEKFMCRLTTLSTSQAVKNVFPERTASRSYPDKEMLDSTAPNVTSGFKR